jgi:large subunit ribosomal protein L18
MKRRKVINEIRKRRTKRVRAIIRGTADRPRLTVFRSHRHIYGQLIDDEAGKTLFSASSLEVKNKAKKTDLAKEVGAKLAKTALKSGIKFAVFDRGRYKYHGRVKAFAEGAREAGLKF